MKDYQLKNELRHHLVNRRYLKFVKLIELAKKEGFVLSKEFIHTLFREYACTIVNAHRFLKLFLKLGIKVNKSTISQIWEEIDLKESTMTLKFILSLSAFKKLSREQKNEKLKSKFSPNLSPKNLVTLFRWGAEPDFLLLNRITCTCRPCRRGKDRLKMVFAKFNPVYKEALVKEYYGKINKYNDVIKKLEKRINKLSPQAVEVKPAIRQIDLED